MDTSSLRTQPQPQQNYTFMNSAAVLYKNGRWLGKAVLAMGGKGMSPLKRQKVSSHLYLYLFHATVNLQFCDILNNDKTSSRYLLLLS